MKEQKVQGASPDELKDELAIEDLIDLIAGPKSPETFADIPIGQISTRMNNHRQDINRVRLKELVSSIERHGLQQRVKVCRRGEEMILVFGFRRLAAFKEMKRAEIPAIVVEGLTDEQIREEQTIENLQREDLTPIDEALLIRELMMNGKRMEVIAATLGKTPSWARERLDLLRIDKNFWPLIASGRVPLKHAFLIARVGDKGEQAELIEGVVGYDGEGGDFVEPLSDLRGRITGTLRKLGSAYWPKNEAYAGRIACVGCPDNTNSEPTLFESLEISVTSSKGNCTNPECFKCKLKAWEKDPEKKRRDREREKAKVEEAKKAMKKAAENPQEGKQLGESLAAREARIKALKKKFPWTAEQKLALALYRYAMAVDKAIEEKLLKSPPANALDVLLVLGKERNADLYLDERTKGFPTLEQTLKGTRLNGAILKNVIWADVSPQFDEYDEPGVDDRGEIRNVPLVERYQEDIAHLAKIAKAWNVDIPRPEAKDFQDTPEEKSAAKPAATGTGKKRGRPRKDDKK